MNLEPKLIGTLRGVGGRGVEGLNAHNKDLIRPISGSIVPYVPPPYHLRVPMINPTSQPKSTQSAGPQTAGYLEPLLKVKLLASLL